MREDKDDLNKLSGGFKIFLLLGITWHVDELDKLMVNAYGNAKGQE